MNPTGCLSSGKTTAGGEGRRFTQTLVTWGVRVLAEGRTMWENLRDTVPWESEALYGSCLQPGLCSVREFPRGPRSPPTARVTSVLGGDGDGISWSVGFLIPF